MWRVFPEPGSPVMTHDVHDDREDPRLDRRSTLEVAKPPVDREEHLLHDVLDARAPDAQPPDGPPDEPDTIVVDLVKAKRQGHHPRRSRHGRALGWELEGGQDASAEPDLFRA